MATAGPVSSFSSSRFDAEHRALFHYRANNSVSCVATASWVHMAAAQENIDRFVVRCHRVDPSFVALKRRFPEQTCVTKIDIGDIQDRQYRHCFELTYVQERLSFFSRLGLRSALSSAFIAARESARFHRMSWGTSRHLRPWYWRRLPSTREFVVKPPPMPPHLDLVIDRAMPGISARQAQQARARGLAREPLLARPSKGRRST